MLSFSHSAEKIDAAIANQASMRTKATIADSLTSMLGENKTKDTIIRDMMVKSGIDSFENSYNFRVTGKSKFVVVGNIEYKDLQTFDSLQHTLPADKREKSLKSCFYTRCKETVDKYGEATIELVADKTKHIIPKMMFFLLPLFALLLRLFYDRKKYLYVDHGIFSLHFHSAYFLLLLVFDIITKVFPSTHRFNDWVIIIGFIYLVFALRNVYQQSLLKSFFKAGGLVISYSIFIFIGFAIVVLTALLF
jgi:hypothetical protein